MALRWELGRREDIINRALLLLLCLFLQGCLTTTKAVFDESNSLEAAESADFMAFVASWETKLPGEDSPRELTEKGARVVELDGQVIVEERWPGGKADYYSLAMIGVRPIICFAHDRDIDVLAERLGVTVEIDRPEDVDTSVPVPVLASGADGPLYHFVRAVFEEGNLVCTVASGTLR